MQSAGRGLIGLTIAEKRGVRTHRRWWRDSAERLSIKKTADWLFSLLLCSSIGGDVSFKPSTVVSAIAVESRQSREISENLIVSRNRDANWMGTRARENSIPSGNRKSKFNHNESSAKCIVASVGQTQERFSLSWGLEINLSHRRWQLAGQNVDWNRGRQWHMESLLQLSCLISFTRSSSQPHTRAGECANVEVPIVHSIRKQNESLSIDNLVELMEREDEEKTTIRFAARAEYRLHEGATRHDKQQLHLQSTATI